MPRARAGGRVGAGHPPGDEPGRAGRGQREEDRRAELEGTDGHQRRERREQLPERRREGAIGGQTQTQDDVAEPVGVSARFGIGQGREQRRNERREQRNRAARAGAGCRLVHPEASIARARAGPSELRRLPWGSPVRYARPMVLTAVVAATQLALGAGTDGTTTGKSAEAGATDAGAG